MNFSSLTELGWIDLTSLAVLSTFLVLGFFRGLIWQLSRFASLILGWVLAQSFAGSLAGYLHEDLELVGPTLAPYVAFFTIFLTVLILLSLLTILIQSYVDKLKLSFFNRMAGAGLGVATAVGLLIGLIGVSYAFFGRSAFAGQIRESHAGRACQTIIGKLDPLLSPALVELYAEPTGEGPENAKGKGLNPGNDPGKDSSKDSEPGKDR